MSEITPEMVEEAMDNQYDGIESCVLVEELLQLQAQLAAAKKQLLEYEQAEAAVCPEDVGVKEYVGLLKAELATAKEESKAGRELWIEAQTARKRLRLALDTEKEKHRWIPVAEGLPKNPEYDFIKIEMLQDGETPHGGYLEGFYKSGASAGRPCFRDSNGCTVNRVTHWRPIHLPEEKENKT